MSFKMSKFKFGKGKDKSRKELLLEPEPDNALFERHLKSLLQDDDIIKNTPNILPTPLDTVDSNKISSPLSPARSLPSPLKSPPSIYSQENENEEMAEVNPENLNNSISSEAIEIENFYLTEQNRHFKKELLHCKLSVDALKKVVQTKEALIAQIQLEKETVEAKFRHLEKVLNWFKNNAPPNLLESCPYSPKNKSTVSLNSNSTSEYEMNGGIVNNSRSSLESNHSNKSKNKRKHDSYRFVRELFKFGSFSNSKSSRTNYTDRSSSDEWLNCDDEGEETVLTEEQMLNIVPIIPSLQNTINTINNNSVQISSPEQVTQKGYSPIKSSAQLNLEDDTILTNISRINASSASPKDINSRAELRNKLFSPEFNSNSPYLSPNASSVSLPLSTNQKQSETEVNSEKDIDYLDVPDIDSELAALTPEDLEAENQTVSDSEMDLIEENHKVNYGKEADMNIDVDIDIDSELAALKPSDLNGDIYNTRFIMEESIEADNDLSEGIEDHDEGNNANTENIPDPKDSKEMKLENSLEVKYIPDLNQNESNHINTEGLKDDTDDKNMNQTKEVRLNETSDKVPSIVINDPILENTKYEEIDGPSKAKFLNKIPAKPTISLPPPPTEPPNLDDITSKLSVKLQTKNTSKKSAYQADDDRPLSTLIRKDQLAKLNKIRTSTIYDRLQNKDELGARLHHMNRLSQLPNDSRKLVIPPSRKSLIYHTEPPPLLKPLHTTSSISLAQSQNKNLGDSHTRNLVLKPSQKHEEVKSTIQSEIDDDMSADLSRNDSFSRKASIRKTQTSLAPLKILKNNPVRKRSNKHKSINSNKMERKVSSDRTASSQGESDQGKDNWSKGKEEDISNDFNIDSRYPLAPKN